MLQQKFVFFLLCIGLGQELHHLAKLNQYLCGILSESGLVENSPTRLGRAVFRYRKSPLMVAYGTVAYCGSLWYPTV